MVARSVGSGRAHLDSARTVVADEPGHSVTRRWNDGGRSPVTAPSRRSCVARWPENRIAPDLARIRRADRAARRPAARVPRDPPRRDQRQDLDRPDDRVAAAGVRAAAPGCSPARTCTRCASGSSSTASRCRVEQFLQAYDDIAPVRRRSSTSGPCAADGPRLSFFEALTGAGVRAVRRRAGRRRGGRDRPRRHLGRDQRRRRGSRGDDAGRPGPPALPRRHHRADRRREGRDHQGRGRVVLAQQPSRPPRCCCGRVARGRADVVRDGIDFGVLGREVAVGGQLVCAAGARRHATTSCSCRCSARTRRTTPPCALAAVESFLGGGTEPARHRGRPAGLRRRDLAGPARGGPRRPDRARRRRPQPARRPRPRRGGAATGSPSPTWSASSAVLADKDAAGLLAALEPLLAEVVVTTNSSPAGAGRRTSWRRSPSTCSARDRVEVVPRLPEALETARRALAERRPPSSAGEPASSSPGRSSPRPTRGCCSAVAGGLSR